MLDLHSIHRKAEQAQAALLKVVRYAAASSRSMPADAASDATGECLSLLTMMAREGMLPIDAAALAERLRRVAEVLDAKGVARAAE